MKKINFLMLIALAFFLWNCRTELETDSLSNSHTHNRNSSKIQFQQFQKETNIKDFKNFLDIASEKKKNAVNKNADLLLAFKIDSENINRLAFNDRQTYTFRAYNIFESPENIYNVLFYKGKTKWEFGLFKIVRNSQNKTEKIIPIYDSSVGELSVAENSVSGKTSCMMDVYFTEFHCTCPPSWGSCDLCSECVSESHSYVFTDCGGDGAGNPIFNSGSSGLPIIYPGTIHDTNNPPAYTPIPQNPSPYYFDPNIPPTIDDGYVRAVRSDNFWSQLDANAKNWAQYNPGMYNALLENYLNKYTIPNNSNNLQFHNWAISFLNENPEAWEQFENWFLNPNVDNDILNELKAFLSENNYTVPIFDNSNYPGKNDGMPFEWWKDNNWMKNNIRIDPNRPNEEPNATELVLFSIYPLQSSFHVKNSNNALNTANQLVNNGKYTHIHNGKADAFRHTFWNALDSADFGKKITLLFTKAHEVGSVNHPYEKQMDLHNNEQGAQLGTNYSTFTSGSTIKDAVINMMDNTSSVWYLTPLADHDGNNILSNTQIKPTN